MRFTLTKGASVPPSCRFICAFAPQLQTNFCRTDGRTDGLQRCSTSRRLPCRIWFLGELQQVLPFAPI